jgi:hypothetical protein
LTPVPLASFALRFSDLAEIEEGCREDEEQRAGRMIDWISARVSSRCVRWLEDWERVEVAAAENDRTNNLRTPWWIDVRQCVEGDHIPSKYEGWNHPVASVCFLYHPQLHAESPQNRYSRTGRVYYAAQSTADFGAAAFSPFRTPVMGGQHTFTVLADHPPGEFSLVRRGVRGFLKSILVYSPREEPTHSSTLSKSSTVYIAICFRSSFLHHPHHLFPFRSHLYGYRQYRTLRLTHLIHLPRGRNRFQILGPQTK